MPAIAKQEDVGTINVVAEKKANFVIWKFVIVDSVET